MTHLELNQLIQECPESPYFTRDDWFTREDEAREIVVKFLEKSMFGNQGPHVEVSASLEHSTPSKELEKRSFEADQGASNGNDKTVNQIQV